MQNNAWIFCTIKISYLMRKMFRKITQYKRNSWLILLWIDGLYLPRVFYGWFSFQENHIWAAPAATWTFLTRPMAIRFPGSPITKIRKWCKDEALGKRESLHVRFFFIKDNKLKNLHRNNSNSRQADCKVRAPNNFIHVMPYNNIDMKHNIVNQVLSINKARCNELIL